MKKFYEIFTFTCSSSSFSVCANISSCIFPFRCATKVPVLVPLTLDLYYKLRNASLGCWNFIKIFL